MRNIWIVLIVLGSGLAVTNASAETVRLDVGATFQRFEQQIKTEIGGARGERLVQETAAGIGVQATWTFLDHLAAGLYLRWDGGTRRAGQFAGVGDDGKTVVAGEVGGAYQELWVGPLVRGQYEWAFVELGYGALGLRWDDARDDLPTTDGRTNAPLRTSATVAWIAAVGLRAPLTETLSLGVRLEYRVRYYDRRDKPLADELVHGTQNFNPFVGLSWAPKL